MTKLERRKRVTGANKMYSDWIKKGINKPGKSAIGLAEAMSSSTRTVNRSAVYKLMNGTRSVHVDELPAISAYIEEPIPMLSSFPVVGGEVLTVPANRVIGSGHWVEEGTTSDDSLSQTVVIFRDSQFPDAKHLAFQYVGDSMDKAGFLDGDMVVCVDFKESGIELVDGQQVVIERNRAGLIDTSIRIVSVERDKIEFQPCSSNPAHKPIVISSKTGKVVGNPNERVDVVAIVRHLARNVR